MKFTIYFMRGDVREITASSVEYAIIICHIQYKETTSWDILKVLNEKGEEV